MKVKYDEFIKALEEKKEEVSTESNQRISLKPFYDFEAQKHNQFQNSEVLIKGEKIYEVIKKKAKNEILLLLVFIILGGFFLALCIKLILSYLIFARDAWDLLERWTWFLENVIFWFVSTLPPLILYFYSLYKSREMNPFTAFEFFVDKRAEKLWKKLIKEDKDASSYRKAKEIVENYNGI